MFPTGPIVFLFHRFEHKWWGVHGLLNGGELAVFLEVNAAVCTEQDVLPAPVVPVFGGCAREEGRGGANLDNQRPWGQASEQGGPSVGSADPSVTRTM